MYRSYYIIIFLFFIKKPDITKLVFMLLFVLIFQEYLPLEFLINYSTCAGGEGWGAVVKEGLPKPTTGWVVNVNHAIDPETVAILQKSAYVGIGLLGVASLFWVAQHPHVLQDAWDWFRGRNVPPAGPNVVHYHITMHVHQINIYWFEPWSRDRV